MLVDDCSHDVSILYENGHTEKCDGGTYSEDDNLESLILRFVCAHKDKMMD